MSDISTKTVSKIHQFYKSELHRIFEKYPYIRPEEASNIHTKLEEKCIEAYKLVLNTHEKLNQTTKPLKKLLRQEFASFKETNSFKVGSIYEHILDTTQLYFQKYSQQIKEASKTNPDFETLKSLSKTFSTQSIYLLEEHIKAEVNFEFVEGHIKTLQHHIDKVWRVYDRENARKSKILEPPQNNGNSFKISTQRPLSVPFAEPVYNTIPKPNRMSTLEPHIPSVPILMTTPPTPTSPPGKLQDSNYLAYLISSTSISCATLQQNKIIPILYNDIEEKTEFVIGEDNGKLILGGIAQNMKFGKKWSPAKDLETLRSEFKYNIQIGRNESAVKIEFLIAFAMSRLKSQGETQTRKKFDHCIICVPAHYSSAQRFRVKTASYVAGFSQSQIISDMSAAAYQFGHTHSQPIYTVVKEFQYEAHPAIFTLDKSKSKLDFTVNRISDKKFGIFLKSKSLDQNIQAKNVIEKILTEHGYRQPIHEKNLSVSQSEDHKKLLIWDSTGWDTVFAGMNIKASDIKGTSIFLEGALKFVADAPVTVIEKPFHRFYTIRLKDKVGGWQELEKEKGKEEFEVDLAPGNILVVQILSPSVHQKIGELLVEKEVKGSACCAVFRLEHGMLEYKHSVWKSKNATQSPVINLEECVIWKQNYEMSKSKVASYQQLLVEASYIIY